jgi:hypothetical protein
LPITSGLEALEDGVEELVLHLDEQDLGGLGGSEGEHRGDLVREELPCRDAELGDNLPLHPLHPGRGDVQPVRQHPADLDQVLHVP